MYRVSHIIGMREKNEQTHRGKMRKRHCGSRVREEKMEPVSVSYPVNFQFLTSVPDET